MPPRDNPLMNSSSARAMIPRSSARLLARTILGGGDLGRPDHFDLSVLPLRRVDHLVADSVDLLPRHLDAEAERELAVQGLVLEISEGRHHLGAVQAAGPLDGLRQRLEGDEAERRPPRIEPAQADSLSQREVRVPVSLPEVRLVRSPGDAFADAGANHRVVLLGDGAVGNVELLRLQAELEGLLGEADPGAGP